MKLNSKVKKASMLLLLIVMIQACKSDNGSYQMDNQAFVNQISNINNFQIAAGTLGETKASSAVTKQYADRMVTEFTNHNTELKSLASSKGWTVSSSLETEQQTRLTALQVLNGAAFDEEYKQVMVSSHQEALDLFNTSSGNNGVRDADLRNYAANKLILIKSQLEEAQAL